MGLFEKQGISQNTTRTLAAHKCDIIRETRVITDDILKKVQVNFRTRLKRVMDKKGCQIDYWLYNKRFLRRILEIFTVYIY